jgi:predicted dehydrogenase
LTSGGSRNGAACHTVRAFFADRPALHHRVIKPVANEIFSNNQVHSTDQAMVDVLPHDITMLPHVLGSDLIEYLATASAGTRSRPDVWDPFVEAAHVVDPGRWYRTSFDAAPERSVTRWLPPDESGLATVAISLQGSETAVLIRYESPERSNRRR